MSRRRWRCLRKTVAAGAVCAILASARPSFGQETRWLAEAITLEERRCLKPETFPGEVAKWLHRDTLSTPIDVHVWGDAASQVHFEIRRLGRGVGRRTLATQGMTCAKATEVVSLAVAMAIEAVLLEPEPEPPPAPKAPPPPVRTAPPPPPPPKPAPTPIRLRAEERVLVNVLPRTALGGSIGVRVPIGSLVLGLDGFGAFAGATSLGSGSVHTLLAGGALSACFERGRRAFSGAGCLGVSGAALRAAGEGFAPSVVTTLPWAAATFGVEGRARVAAWLSLVGGVDLYVPWLRPTLEVRSPQEAVSASRQVPPVGVALRLGLEAGAK